MRYKISDTPENNRWSFNKYTKCGLEAYFRPCQQPGVVDQPGAAYPLPNLCGTDMEAVFVAESDEAEREYLMEIIRDLGFLALGVSTASELYELVPHYKTGCILLDMTPRGGEGLALQEHLNKTGANLPMVFISTVSDAPTIVQCMRLGAADFIQKPIAEISLRWAVIAAVADSQRRYCISSSRMIVNRLIASLTFTERKVAELIARGFPTKVIATEMGRSENTVKIHRQRIFSKLMVNSAASVSNIMHHGNAGHRRSDHPWRDNRAP
jgi:FixJ family two-component response regulator